MSDFEVRQIHDNKGAGVCITHGAYFDTRCPRCSPIERALAPRDEPIANKMLRFLSDLCHPDELGYAVTAEVRKRARELANEIEEKNHARD